jgi:hypothetical protein
MPKTIAKFTGTSLGPVKINAPCFTETTISAYWPRADSITITFDSHEKKSLLCQDAFLITTLASHDLKLTIFTGKSSTTYKLKDQTEVDLVKLNGIHVMTNCDGFSRYFVDLLQMVPLALGDVLPTTLPKFLDFLLKWSENDNKKFQQEYIGRTYKGRTQKYVFDGKFLEANVRSGDVMSCAGYNVISSLIMVTAGGPIVHNGLALWQDDKLWFINAKGNSDGLAWLTPTEMLAFCNRGLIWQRLGAESRAKFDATKAWAWFENGRENLPYGFGNMHLNWVDVGTKNMPLVTDINGWFVLWSLIEKLSPSIGYKMLGSGLNNRLGTEQLTIPQLVLAAAAKGKTLSEVQTCRS